MKPTQLIATTLHRRREISRDLLLALFPINFINYVPSSANVKTADSMPRNRQQ